MNSIVTRFISGTLQSGDTSVASNIEQNLSDAYYTLKAALGQFFGLDSSYTLIHTPRRLGGLWTFHEGLSAAHSSQHRL
ncbi:MAG: hypothetical protein AAGF95_24800 [Chloroflexota bacterium]